jgi:hypothetical protein
MLSSLAHNMTHLLFGLLLRSGKEDMLTGFDSKTAVYPDTCLINRESGYFEKPAHVIRNSVFHLRGDHSIHWGDKLLAWDREHCSGETIKAICPFRQELGFSPAMDGVVSFQTSESRFGRVSK